MRALVQRVAWAQVDADGEIVAYIDRGLLVYVCAAVGDTDAHAQRLAEKVAACRIFPDRDEKMNLTVRDAQGGVLAVPNFTLLADTRKGNRPAFVAAAPPDRAQPLFRRFVAALARIAGEVPTGVFGAHMLVHSCADGPVNVTIDVPADGAA